MKRFIIRTIILTSIFLSYSGTKLFSQSYWQTNLIYGREIKYVYADVNNLFAVTNIGTFYSTDGGNFWSNLKLPNYKYNFSCSRVLTIGDDIFISSGNYIFKTSNYGLSWNEYQISKDYLFVVALRNKGDTLIAGTNIGIFISSYLGEYWEIFNSGLSNYRITDLAISEEKIFTATYGGVFLSTDNGNNWIPKNNGLASLKDRSLYFLNEDLYMGNDSGKIFKTTDYGDNWAEISNGQQLISGVSSISSIDGYLIAGTDRNGLFRTSNGGQNWIPTNSGFSVVPNVLSLETYNNRIFAGIGSQAKGLYSSTNQGSSWSVVNSGLNSGVFRSITGRGANIYAGIEFGTDIYKTTNNGSSWVIATTVTNNALLQTFVFKEPYAFAGTIGKGLYRSPSDSFQWQRIGLSELPDDIVDLMSKDELIFVRTNDGEIFRSSDNGISWIIVNNGLTGAYVQGITASEENIVATANTGIFYSTNNGDNWINAKSLNTTFYSLISIDSLTFASSNMTGLLVSTNSGVNWLVRNSLAPGFLNANKNILIGTIGGVVHMSYDRGFTWLIYDQGIWGPTISEFYFSDEYIFAASYNGVYRLKISDIVGVNSHVQNVSENFSLYQNYPNPFNPVTRIRFDIQENSIVKLKVFDLSGREIQTIYNKASSPGTYFSEFDGSDLASGIYFCRIEVNGQKTDRQLYSKTIKMLLVK
jgi:photosystem II stability/assembly factor-like uncharacterized protein